MRQWFRAWTLGAVLVVAAAAAMTSMQDDGDASRSGQTSAVDAAFLKRVQPLFANVKSERFVTVREIAQLVDTDGREAHLVHVRWTIAAGEVEHGAGELLVFAGSNDAAQPLARMSTFTIGSRFEVIDGRWLRLENDVLMPLTVASFNHLADGCSMVARQLGLEAVTEALSRYMQAGSGGFLERVLAVNKSADVLPRQINAFVVYPSLVDDVRTSDFRYSSPWEVTVFVRLMPSDGSLPVILELGACGASAGIDASMVRLVLWQTRDGVPGDRPAGNTIDAPNE
ncbi:MAG: hypothetical protein ACR2GY_12940 [Phycisphaerales bacterium]